jgi:hypothetical protein
MTVKKAKKSSSAAAKTEKESKSSAPVDAQAADEAAWIELFPSGISFGSGVGRPVLVLKDQHGVEVLPVWMHPLDAAVGLAELSTGSGATPHAVTRRVFETLRLRVESCSFVELKGHHQYVLLQFAGHEAVKALKVRADEAMSFCLQAKARFFSTKDFMSRCRDMDQDLAEIEGTLANGGLKPLQAEREMLSKKHPYVM